MAKCTQNEENLKKKGGGDVDPQCPHARLHSQGGTVT